MKKKPHRREFREVTLTPIETTYHGARFRSRLEARWAVCFSSLGIPWEYEPEGYRLDKGPYLPDFRLWGSLLAEVKPVPSPEQNATFYEDLLERVRGIDSLALLVGQPRVMWYPVLVKAPAALMWIDLDRCSIEKRVRLSYAQKRPPKEDLFWPHLRFERAVLAASFERFDGNRGRAA
jgi:hypothetical protein